MSLRDYYSFAGYQHSMRNFRILHLLTEASCMHDNANFGRSDNEPGNDRMQRMLIGLGRSPLRSLTRLACNCSGSTHGKKKPGILWTILLDLQGMLPHNI
jgi:hypothetical protein